MVFRSAVRAGVVSFRLGLLLLLVSSTLRPAFADAKGVLPPASAVKGWKQLGAPKLYNPSNLYDLIDGEAQAVLTYSFVACAHAEYAPANSARPVLTIDVYDMSDPLNAFGLFGSDRRSGKATAVGTEGVLIAPSGLNFWKGRYVVRTAIVQVSPANQAAQLAFAKATAAKITGASSLPPVLKLLPPGYTPGSQNYQRSDVAGQSYLKNGISARYPTAGPLAELFVVQLASPAEAKAAYTKYQGFLSDAKNLGAGAKPTPVKGVGESAMAVKTRLSGFIVAALKGKSIVAVRKAKDPNSAQTLVKSALSRVK